MHHTWHRLKAGSAALEHCDCTKKTPKRDADEGIQQEQTTCEVLRIHDLPVQKTSDEN
jgi:hypothetical protein